MTQPKTQQEIDAEKAAKPAIDVVPPALMIAAAKALGIGKRKHGVATPDGFGTWRLAGTEQATALTHYSSLIRHLLAWRNGEEIDPEYGLPHLHHAAAQLAILLDIEERPPGSRVEDRDVRVPKAEPEPVPERPFWLPADPKPGVWVHADGITRCAATHERASELLRKALGYTKSARFAYERFDVPSPSWSDHGGPV